MHDSHVTACVEQAEYLDIFCRLSLPAEGSNLSLARYIHACSSADMCHTPRKKKEDIREGQRRGVLLVVGDSTPERDTQMCT